MESRLKVSRYGATRLCVELLKYGRKDLLRHRPPGDPDRQTCICADRTAKSDHVRCGGRLHPVYQRRAAGADLLFASIVAELKERGYPLYLEAALPYAGRKTSKNRDFQAMLATCDEIRTFSEQYTRGCYFVRNRYMVDESSRVIAVYDGRKNGGTAYTMRYARDRGKTVQIIKI